MSLQIMTIPDDFDQQAPWLEKQLVGDSLSDLVAELSALHSKSPALEQVRAVVEPHLEAVCQSGLGAVPREHLTLLLLQPRYLFELQEKVLTEGGPYWDKIERPAGVEQVVNQGWQRLEQQLAIAEKTPVQHTTTRKQRSNALAVLLALAAGLLIGFFLFDLLGKSGQPVNPLQQTVAWGWAKSLPTDKDGNGYLKALATGAEEWFNKKPEEVAALAQRITEFRQGCTRVQLAQHPALNDERRKWLLERCQKWSAALDQQLAKLETGKDVQSVRDEVDGIVRKLATALREKATAS